MASTTRPPSLSGEIVTGRANRAFGARGSSPKDDFLDAEFTTVARASEARPASAAGAAYADPLRGEAADTGRATLLRSQQMAKASARNGGPLFWAAGIGAVALAFWISGGHALVTDTAAKPVVEGLRVAGFTSRLETSGPSTYLLVEGEVENQGRGTLSMPPLSIDIRDGDGRTTRYLIGTSGDPLPAGSRFAFQSRVSAPASGVEVVSVRLGETKVLR